MNSAQKIFVDEMIKHGNEEKAVLKAYPHLKGDKKRIRTYCGRLMKNVEVSTIIQQKAKEIEELATNKAVDELKGKIVANTLEAIEKRNLLAQIARGDMRITETYVNSKGQVKKYDRHPDAYEKMKAIEMDNKMSGDNAPSKVDLTQPVINFVSASSLTAEQLKKFQDSNVGNNDNGI